MAAVPAAEVERTAATELGGSGGPRDANRGTRVRGRGRGPKAKAPTKGETHTGAQPPISPTPCVHMHQQPTVIEATPVHSATGPLEELVQDAEQGVGDRSTSRKRKRKKSRNPPPPRGTPEEGALDRTVAKSARDTTRPTNRTPGRGGPRPSGTQDGPARSPERGGNTKTKRTNLCTLRTQ